MGYSFNGTDSEVDDWVARVVGNGGSVSAATKRAVLRLVMRLKDTGVWSNILRCNCFAGTGLAAALVPLKSSGLTGNATETNNGPFVSGDYTEGSLGLRAGSGNTKYLDTGFVTGTAGLSNIDLHGSVYLLDDLDTADATSAPFFATSTTPTTEYGLGSSTAMGYNGKSTAPYLGPGHFAFTARPDGVQTVNGYQVCRYMPGSAAGTLGGSSSLLLFAGMRLSSLRIGWGAIGWYSIGNKLTDQQLRDMTKAVESFQVEMGRVSKKPLCVAFGDSITRGFGLTAASQRWARQYATNRGEREINFGIDNCRLRADYTAGNPYALAGINRYTEIFSNLIVKPHAVAILLGTNDCYDDPDNTIGTQSIADDYQAKLQTIVQYLLDNGVLAANIVIGSPPYGTDAHLSSATKIGKYVAAAQAAAVAKSVKFADVYNPTLALGSGGLQLDGIHPTATTGQATIGTAFTAAA